MIICLKCNAENIDDSMFCRSCGHELTSDSIKTFSKTVPDGVAGWSWGAFFIAPIWAIGNKTWIGLLALIPYVGFIVAIIMGIKGREWAWKNNNWDSIEHFNRVQRQWSLWGAAVPALILFGIFAAVAIPKLAATSEDAQAAQEQSTYDSTTTNDIYSAESAADATGVPIENTYGQTDSDCAYGTLEYNADGTTTCTQ